MKFGSTDRGAVDVIDRAGFFSRTTLRAVSRGEASINVNMTSAGTMDHGYSGPLHCTDTEPLHSAAHEDASLLR